MAWQESSATKVRTGELLRHAIGKGNKPRRTTYDPTVAGDILRAVMEDGEYLADAAAQAGVPPSTLYQWRAAQPELQEAIAIARAIGAETKLAKTVRLLEQAETQVDVNKADKLVRNAQWYAERMAPQDYADIAARGTSKVADSLASLLEAMSRAETAVDVTPEQPLSLEGEEDQ